MKVIIAGGRDFRDYNLLSSSVTKALVRIRNLLPSVPIEIVSGGQVTIDPKTKEKYGADYLGEKYAKEVGFPIKRFVADWDRLGKKAGPIRNKQMADYCDEGDALIAFWDGKSIGTRDMISKATEAKLRTKVINY